MNTFSNPLKLEIYSSQISIIHTFITINLGLYYLYYKSGTEEGPYPRPKRLPKI